VLENRERLERDDDTVMSLDRSGTVLSWSVAAESIFGYTAAEAIGRTVDALHLADDLSAVLRDEFAHRHAEPRAVRLRSRRQDGREIIAELHVSVHCGADGAPIAVIGCSPEFTEHVRIEAALHRQREEQQIILDAMPAMVWYKDRENRILRANRAAAESIGKTPAELVGASTYDLYPEDAGHYHQDDLEVIRSGRPKLGIIEHMRTGTGDLRWVRTDKIPYRDEHGEIVGVIVFAVDITDYKRAEAALERSRDELDVRVRERTAELAEAVESLQSEIAERGKVEERLELALSAAELGLWDWNPTTNSVVFDQRWAELIGLPLEQVEQHLHSWRDRVHPEDLPLAMAALNEHVVEQRRPYYESEHRVRTESGEYRWIRARGRVVQRAKDGSALRVTGTYRDVTARKRVEEEMRRHQAALAHLLRLQTVEGMTAEIMHEMNQPLGAIANFANGLAERLRRGTVEAPAMLDAAEQIGAEAVRAARVLQRVRNFSRKHPPQRLPCDLNRLVHDAAQLIEPDMRRHRISLRLSLDTRLPLVDADAIQVEQVILNLLRNGVEAIADVQGGEREVAVETTRVLAGEV